MVDIELGDFTRVGGISIRCSPCVNRFMISAETRSSFPARAAASFTLNGEVSAKSTSRSSALSAPWQPAV